MKLWLRLSFGILAGAFLGFFLPLTGGDTLAAFNVYQQIIINIGRYILFPLVFFSTAIGIYELWLEMKLHRVGFILSAAIPTATLLTVVTGVLGVLFTRPDRIPIIIKEADQMVMPTALNLLREIFPSNMFAIFTGNSSYLLPVMVGAILLGIAFHYPKAHAGPSIELFDSLSRLFFRISFYLMEFMIFGLGVLSGFRVLQIRGSSDLDLFMELLLILGGLFALLAFIVYPTILFLLGGRKNPYTWLRGSAMPMLAGLLSGDSYFAIPFLFRFGRDHHYIPRKLGSSTYSFTMMFGRSGTAMVIAVSFLVILQSYSSLELTIFQYLWVLISSFGVSFLLIGVPSAGVLVGLALISQWYGQGLEEGYLILLPAAPFLVAIGVMLDTLTSSLITTLVSRWSNLEMMPKK